MTTLKMLRDQIVNDNNLAGNVSFPDLRLNRMINLAMRLVQTSLNSLGMKRWENSVVCTTGLTATTFAGVNVKAISISALLPQLAESPNAIKFFDVGDGTNNGIAYEIGENLFYENITNSFLTPTIKKPKFTRLAGNALLVPSSITSAIAYYYKTVADLSADSDISDIPPEFDGQILKAVQIELDSILGKLNDKASALADLNEEIKNSFEQFQIRKAETKQDQQLQ